MWCCTWWRQWRKGLRDKLRRQRRDRRLSTARDNRLVDFRTCTDRKGGSARRSSGVVPEEDVNKKIGHFMWRRRAFAPVKEQEKLPYVPRSSDGGKKCLSPLRLHFFSLSLCYPSSNKALCGGSRTKVTSASYQNVKQEKQNFLACHLFRNIFFLFMWYWNILLFVFPSSSCIFFPTEFCPFPSCASCARARGCHFVWANANSWPQDR